MCVGCNRPVSLDHLARMDVDASSAWPDGLATIFAAAADLLVAPRVWLLAHRDHTTTCLQLEEGRLSARPPLAWEHDIAALARSGPVVVADVVGGAGVGAARVAPSGLGALAAQPLRAVDGEAIGVLCVGHEGPHRWSPLEVQALVGWAATAERLLGDGVRTGGDRQRGDLQLAQLVELLESSPDHVLTADGSGRMLWCNGAARALFGIASLDELRQQARSFLDHLSDESRLRYVEQAQPELWASGVWVGDVDARSAGGTTVPLSLSVMAHVGADGYPEHFSLVGRDISAAKAAAQALADSEARMRTLVDAAPIGIFETNPFGYCTYVNPAFVTITGLADADDALGFGWGNVVHPDDAVAVGTAWAVAVHTDSPFAQQFRFVASDGSVVWADAEAIPVHDESGRTTMFLGTIDDVTERLELERARFESAELFRTAFDHAPTGMVLTDVTTAEPILVQCNDEYAQILGRTVEEIRGMNLLRLTHPDDVDGVLAGRMALIRGDIDHHHTEVRTLRPDGTWIWTSLTRSIVRDADGRPRYSLSQVSDVTEQKEVQQRIERFAFTDTLTGLPNRRAFVDALDRAIATRRASGRPVALLFVDLDHFKTVNDHLGHDAGDALLVAVAEGLLASVRASDVVARIGGDEFAVIITDAGGAEMGRIADRLRETMRFPRELPDGSLVTVTASIGLAWAAGEESTDELLRRADEAMYEAKHLGRDRLVEHAG